MSGGGNQRAFSTRIVREPAGNIRRHVAISGGSNSSNVMAGIGRTSVSSSKSRPMSTTSSSHTIGPDTEGLEPIDYEEYVSNHSERDPLSLVLEFPPEDLEVNIVPRKIRSIHHVLPPEPYAELDPTVQNCVDCYTSDWVVVTRKYQQYSSSVTIRDRSEEKLSILSSLQRQEFEIDDTPDPSPQYPEDDNKSGSETPRGSWASFDLRTSKPDDLLPGLLDKVDPDLVDEENGRRRMENRPEALFSLYPEQDEFTMVERDRKSVV